MDRHTDKHYPDVKFDLAPSANLQVTIEDSQLNGMLEVLGDEANDTIGLNIHRSEMKNPYSIRHGVVRIKLDDKARNCNLVVRITDSKISDTKGPGLNLDTGIEGLFAKKLRSY